MPPRRVVCKCSRCSTSSYLGGDGVVHYGGTLVSPSTRRDHEEQDRLHATTSSLLGSALDPAALPNPDNTTVQQMPGVTRM
jgi:hypothetical protein